MDDDVDIPDEIIVTPWDVVEHIRNDDDEIEYLNAVLELNDPALAEDALRVIVRARGLRQGTPTDGVDLQSLSHALGESAAVDLGTALRVLSALGIKLVAIRVDQVAEG